MKSYLESTRSVRRAASTPLHLSSTPHQLSNSQVHLSNTPQDLVSSPPSSEIGVRASRRTLRLVPTSDDRVDIIVVDDNDDDETDY